MPRCRNGEFKVFADEFKVDKYFRFEGASNSLDSAILYAISSDSKNLKDVLVNAYGIYSEPITNEMLENWDTAMRICAFTLLITILYLQNKMV